MELARTKDSDLCEDEIEGLVSSLVSSPSARTSSSNIGNQKKTLLFLILMVVLFVNSMLSFLSKNDADMNSPAVAGNVGIEADGVAETWNAIWENAHLLPMEDGNKNNNQKDNEAILTSDSSLASTSLNATLTAHGGNLLTLDAQELFGSFPPPVRTDTIQIYNKEAYHELIKIVTSKKSNINICANGGSSTAGGGKVPKLHRYYTKFAKYIQQLNLNAAGGKVNIIERGHGTRHSLHSAVFASNFLPPNTDLLLWEFAINDYAYGDYMLEESHIEQERSLLIAWLREVEQMRPRPPKVILIYLWKTPFELNEEEKINNPVYDAHAQLAKEFDFVVGHVNLATYFDEPNMPRLEDLQRLFLSDPHHPSSAGHLAVTFLLLNLLRGKGEWSSSKSIVQPKLGKVEKYKWFCGTETEEKRFLQSRIVEGGDASSGWRSPLGTVTLEEPQNKVVSGSRQLVFDPESSDGMKILGKQDPLRKDRQGSVSLACCTGNSNSNFTTVGVPGNTEPMQNVQAMFLGFGRGMSDITDLKVYIESDSKDVNGKLIRDLHDWPCFWAWRDIYDSLWFAFSEEQPKISSIQICVENEQCEDNGQSDAMLISMAVY
jgi:hypothetical protein